MIWKPLLTRCSDKDLKKPQGAVRSLASISFRPVRAWVARSDGTKSLKGL